MGIDFSRIVNSVKQTIQDTRSNSVVSKEYLYNHYLNKLHGVQIDADYLLNSHDYEVLSNYVGSIENEDTLLYVEKYLELHKSVYDIFNSILISNLMYVYQNYYNRIKVLHQIKNSHFDTPVHIQELEKELFSTVYNSKNVMFFMFGSLRQVLQNSSEVFVLESYCEPQQGFRKLESLVELPIVDTSGYHSFIDNEIQSLTDQYEQLKQMLSLIKEQVSVLILYYQQFDVEFSAKCINHTVNPYESNMYNNQPTDYVNRSEELKHLQNIIQNK